MVFQLDKANVVNKISNINWKRYWVFLSTILLFWTLIGVLVPANHYKVITTIFNAIVSSIGYFIRATKWVEERGTVPNANEQI